MPELPEVQTVAVQLGGHLKGRKFKRLIIRDSKLAVREHIPSEMAVRSVFRSGKQVVIELGGAGRSPLFIVIHLRMTGRLIWRDRAVKPRGRAPRAVLVFNGGIVEFTDLRRFGTLAICRSLSEFQPPGLDPLSKEFSVLRLSGLLAEARQNLKAFLMRQDKITGIGNIYASEILFRAKLDPLRSTGSLSRAEIKALHAAIRAVLQKAVECCGTTFSDYADARGLSGTYQRLLKVYEREGERCRCCRQPILRRIIQQRSTYYCGKCQV